MHGQPMTQLNLRQLKVHPAALPAMTFWRTFTTKRPKPKNQFDGAITVLPAADTERPFQYLCGVSALHYAEHSGQYALMKIQPPDSLSDAEIEEQCWRDVLMHLRLIDTTKHDVQFILDVLNEHCSAELLERIFEGGAHPALIRLLTGQLGSKG